MYREREMPITSHIHHRCTSAYVHTLRKICSVLEPQHCTEAEVHIFIDVLYFVFTYNIL